MTLYEIDRKVEEICSRINPETGEIEFDPQELEELAMERETKCENIALLIKNYKSDVVALKTEADALTARKKIIENKIARLENYLSNALKFEKFSTPKCVVSFRKSEKTVIQDEERFFEWAKNNAHEDFINREVKETPDKRKIKEAIEKGEEIEFVQIVENKSIQIK